MHELYWLGWKDLNPRNNGVRVRCLTTWRHPNICTELFSFIIISLLRAIVNRKNIFLFFNFILWWKSSSSRVKMTDCRSALFAYKYIFSFLLAYFLLNCLYVNVGSSDGITCTAYGLFCRAVLSLLYSYYTSRRAAIQ